MYAILVMLALSLVGGMFKFTSTTVYGSNSRSCGGSTKDSQKIISNGSPSQKNVSEEKYHSDQDELPVVEKNGVTFGWNPEVLQNNDSETLEVKKIKEYKFEGKAGVKVILDQNNRIHRLFEHQYSSDDWKRITIGTKIEIQKSVKVIVL